MFGSKQCLNDGGRCCDWLSGVLCDSHGYSSMPGQGLKPWFHKIGLAVESPTAKKGTQESGPDVNR